MDDPNPNLRWHPCSVTAEERCARLGHKSCILWLTGLPSSGKSTLANALSRTLHDMGVLSYVLDGDNIRHGLNRDLGFSPAGRTENIRRIGEVARLFADAGLVIIVAFISPLREDRLQARAVAPEGSFIEVFVKCAPGVCEERDPKGMYRKAKAGLIPEFTGVSAPYEEPENPEIVLETAQLPVETCVGRVLDYLSRKGIIHLAVPAAEADD